MDVRRILWAALSGSAIGAGLLGGGGRIVMRALALQNGRPPNFSLSGTLDILAYGALVGGAAGAVAGVLPKARLSPLWLTGVLLGLLAYAATILTLPAHIAGTAAPFRDAMALVHAGFGLCFVVFGLALAWLLVRLPGR